MRTIRELRLRALSELVVNTSITTYDMIDGREVNRRRPRFVHPLDGLKRAFTQMRDTVQNELFYGIASLTPKFKEFGDAFDVR